MTVLHYGYNGWTYIYLYRYMHLINYIFYATPLHNMLRKSWRSRRENTLVRVLWGRNTDMPSKVISVFEILSVRNVFWSERNIIRVDAFKLINKYNADTNLFESRIVGHHNIIYIYIYISCVCVCVCVCACTSCTYSYGFAIAPI